MRGWWWLPGEKNDALFARIKEAAQLGKNDEVMEFIVTREDSQVYGGAKIDFIRDKQIPMLEKNGFMYTLASEWFWLGYQYFRNNQPEDGFKAYDKVQKILNPSDIYYALVPYACDFEQKLSEKYKGKSKRSYLIGANAEEYRYIGDRLCYWKSQGIGDGYLNSVDCDINHIFRNSSYCDGLFFIENISVGETYTGTDGTTLTYVSDCETVETSCGIFEDCQLWITKHYDYDGYSIYKSYYKSGIGIVKHEHKLDGFSDVRTLKSYSIVGGKGLLPLAVGNTWEYDNEYLPDIMTAYLQFTVSYADDRSVIISSNESIERLKYNENSWRDTIEEIRNEYFKEKNGQETICNIYSAIERAETLAETAMEKAHTKAACSVARRILETDTTFNPNYIAIGHWNFFSKNIVHRKNDVVVISHNRRWSFEWKSNTGSAIPLLFIMAQGKDICLSLAV